MVEKKKLQVFVSSTYIDLKEERQAAVQAILNADHIPAGMELFSAGDRTQMEVIKRWIDESDVFLLILGGRYGTVETSSQKSYTHLEYEYALEKGKALFAVVANQKALEERIKTSKLGLQLMEQENQHKLKEFRKVVCSDKIVKFWSDSKDIELAILKTLSEFSRREELIGWIPGNQAVNTEELARLAKENSELREQVSNLSSQLANNRAIFNGLTYEELYQILNESKFDFDICDSLVDEKLTETLQQISEAFGDSKISPLHCFWSMRKLFGQPNLSYFSYKSILNPLIRFGLLTSEQNNKGEKEYTKLTECGQSFLNCLIKNKKNNPEVNKFFFNKEDLDNPEWMIDFYG
jgi:hypothetical protein